MAISNGNILKTTDINTVITKVNNTYARYGYTKNITAVSNNQKALKSLCTTMINDLNQCINKSAFRRKYYYKGSTLSSLSNLIKASEMSNISTIADQVYNDYCNCNSNCSCDCNYCSCNCNYCSCDCNYCRCNCNYCSCDCNYCSCDCDYCCDNCSCDCDYCRCDCDNCSCDCNHCSCDCDNCSCDCNYCCDNCCDYCCDNCGCEWCCNCDYCCETEWAT